jgi:eukaryotic-like serine/threonine-protein kinase
MNGSEWDEVKSALSSLLAVPEQEREALLETLDLDVAVRDEVQSLLDAHAADPVFGDEPVGSLLGSHVAAAVPARIQQYEIVRHLASGGMGEVYLATDEALGRQIALKVLSTRYSQDSGRVRRLEQEARAASALNHPNIVTVHELGRDGSTCFIAQEYVEGVTLRERLRSGPMSHDEIVAIAGQIAAALHVAHSAGVIHRDIKPENIMLRNDGLVKILDFGIAKFLSDAIVPRPGTSAGLILGTVDYMSPEQLRGLDVDTRTDLWSLGVVMFEMFAGRRPFEAPTVSDAIARILETEPLPAGSTVPLPMRRIIRQALSKDRQARYSSAADLARDLRVAQRGRDNIATALLESLRPGWRLATALLVLTATLGVAGWNVFGRPAAPTPPPPRTMLAVLPFESLGGDAVHAYFTDGLTEDTTNEFGRLAPAELGVIARTSTARYKGARADARAIGRELGVDYVVEAGVRRSGDRIQVTAQLIRAADGAQVWSQSYEKSLEETFTIQSELASDVAREMGVRIAPAAASRPARLPRSAEGREAFLRGRYELQFGRLENRERALKHFADAAAADPDSALVHAETARALLSLATFRYAPAQIVPLARASVLRALELEPELAEAHQVLGTIHLEYDWNWEAAERALKRSIELNPNLAVAHATYASVLVTAGRFDEGLRESARAMALDPLSPAQHEQMVWQWISARRWNEAADHSRAMIEIEPTRSRSYNTLAVASLALGDLPSARQAAAHQAVSETPTDRASAAHVYARLGDVTRARDLLAELETAARDRYVCAYNVATIHAALGELDLAFASLEQGFRDRSG